MKKFGAGLAAAVMSLGLMSSTAKAVGVFGSLVDFTDASADVVTIGTAVIALALTIQALRIAVRLLKRA